MNFNRIGKLNNLVSNDLKRKPTIILDPNPEQSYRMFGTANDIIVGIDADDWEVPEELNVFIEEIAGSGISNEEMILKIYQKLCEDYTYDDNVLSYIKKNVPWYILAPHMKKNRHRTFAGAGSLAVFLYIFWKNIPVKKLVCQIN